MKEITRLNSSGKSILFLQCTSIPHTSNTQTLPMIVNIGTQRDIFESRRRLQDVGVYSGIFGLVMQLSNHSTIHSSLVQHRLSHKKIKLVLKFRLERELCTVKKDKHEGEAG